MKLLHDKEGFVFQASLSKTKNYFPHDIIRPSHRIEPPVYGKVLSEMPQSFVFSFFNVIPIVLFFPIGGKYNRCVGCRSFVGEIHPIFWTAARSAIDIFPQIFKALCELAQFQKSRPSSKYPKVLGNDRLPFI